MPLQKLRAKWLFSRFKGALVLIIATSLCVARAGPPPAENPKDYTTHVVGYAHIDMAWLWRWEESVHDIMYHTFLNQLHLMDADPDYTFAQDQAIVYDMVERFYPDIYKAIAEKVKTKNWIPVSSTWTQMDENMPDGESLVRQFLYGQKATKQRFGRYGRVAWQPDVFGHPWSMPQIARKSGIEFFLFNRPHDPNRPPIIWWQGLDGSRILGYSTPDEYVGTIDHHRTTEMSMANARRMGVKNMMLLYGTGDHGGGPNPNDLAMIGKLNASQADVRVKTTRVEDYFDLLLTEKRDFPVVNGELNSVFEGCYTTQADMKLHNREAEQLLLAAEKMSEISVINRFRDYFPTRDVGEAWKLALLNQTHDLLPGSGIAPIYKDAARQYDEISERGRRALDFSLQCIGMHVNTRGEGVPLVVYNTQSWDRTGLVMAEISGSSLPSNMVAAHGPETTPVQFVGPVSKDANGQRAKIMFVARAVPQMGLKLYKILPAPERVASSPNLVKAGMEPRPFLENGLLRVEFDSATGNIVRLFDKKANRETLREQANTLVALEDTNAQAMKVAPEYAGPAWDLGLTGAAWNMEQGSSIQMIEHGPVRATMRIVHHFRKSAFTLEVSLIAGSPRVDVGMAMDWHERNTFLKVGFPVAGATGKVASEIPYGVIERDQTGKEMPMGKWVDISGAGYGVAILNSGRHGFDAKDGIIRVSAIRGPTVPDPRTDEGLHSFGYSVYPHHGDWREGKVEFQALEFNSPLLALQEPLHDSSDELAVEGRGTLADSFSFVKTGSDHVILYAMKQMEGFYDTDSILRFFECEGRPGEVSLEFPFKVRAVEANLLEDMTGPLGEGSRIKFSVRPWEIKTVRLARVDETK